MVHKSIDKVWTLVSLFAMPVQNFILHSVQNTKNKIIIIYGIDDERIKLENAAGDDCNHVF